MLGTCTKMGVPPSVHLKWCAFKHSIVAMPHLISVPVRLTMLKMHGKWMLCTCLCQVCLNLLTEAPWPCSIAHACVLHTHTAQTPCLASVLWTSRDRCPSTLNATLLQRLAPKAVLSRCLLQSTCPATARLPRTLLLINAAVQKHCAPMLPGFPDLSHLGILYANHSNVGTIPCWY